MIADLPVPDEHLVGAPPTVVTECLTVISPLR
jgi:hypothetical protein